MFSASKTFGFSKKSFRFPGPQCAIGRRKVPQKYLLSVLLFSLCAGILVAVAAVYLKVRDDTVPLTGRHVVFLIDLTDGLTDEQYNSVRQELEYRKNSLRVGDWFSIYTIEGTNNQKGPGKALKLFSNWRLPDGSQTDFVTKNPNLLKKRFNEQFDKPLQKAQENINPENTADTSPILETIMGVAKSNEFARATQREVIIFSNLLQKSEAVNQYVSLEDFSVLRDQSLRVLDVQGMLSKSDVTAFLIPYKKNHHLQNKKHDRFWNEYFAHTGAASFKIKTL